RRRTYRPARLAIDFLGKAVFALKPFPLLGDQIDHRDWTAANLTGHFCYIVKVHLRWRANDTVGFECRKSVALVFRNWTFHGVAYLTADIALPIGSARHQINPVMPRGAAHSLPKLIHPREQETDPDPIIDSGDRIPLMLTVASMWMPIRESEVVCGPAAAIPPI